MITLSDLKYEIRTGPLHFELSKCVYWYIKAMETNWQVCLHIKYCKFINNSFCLNYKYTQSQLERKQYLFKGLSISITFRCTTTIHVIMFGNVSQFFLVYIFKLSDFFCLLILGFTQDSTSYWSYLSGQYFLSLKELWFLEN